MTTEINKAPMYFMKKWNARVQINRSPYFSTLLYSYIQCLQVIKEAQKCASLKMLNPFP